ncbi:MAG: polysaccharide deacetylase family protein [Acidobacteriota bacterium]|nr:polysaccharide deacetylase family protein [Acidobacteriota bacterium]MDP2389733.1 polysaccharide deacetylase family protein [Acidobacteriota bacterium]
MPLLIVLLVGAAVLAHAAPFPFLLEAFRPSRSVWHVPPTPGVPPTIYLTFDDGPNPVWTPPLLDALREQGAHATFFLIDDHITPETAAIVKRIADEGHAIGLHSGTRAQMIDDPEALAAWLDDRADRIEAIAGEPPCRLFRPHAGWRSGTMYEGLEDAGFTLAGWSWGMWDWDWWREPSGDHVARKLVKKASPGDIVVIHDGHHKNPRAQRRHAGETVTRLAPLLRQKGFRFGTLCDPASSRTAE